MTVQLRGYGAMAAPILERSTKSRLAGASRVTSILTRFNAREALIEAAPRNRGPADLLARSSQATSSALAISPRTLQHFQPQQEAIDSVRT